MTTPRPHPLVSLATALAAALGPAACAPAPARLAADAPAPLAAAVAAPLALAFDNEAPEHVHVYLVGEQREWLLGRVAPGARATLRIPAAALAENPGFVRLAVLAGEAVTLQAAGAARTVVTLAQPASALATQRWAYSRASAQGQLTPFRLAGARPAGGSAQP